MKSCGIGCCAIAIAAFRTGDAGEFVAAGCIGHITADASPIFTTCVAIFVDTKFAARRAKLQPVFRKKNAVIGATTIIIVVAFLSVWTRTSRVTLAKFVVVVVIVADIIMDIARTVIIVIIIIIIRVLSHAV